MIKDERQREIYARHIMDKLKEAGLDDAQIAKVAPRLLRRIDFMEKEIPLSSELFDYLGKIETGARLLGIEEEQYRDAAASQPQLFRVSPHTVNSHSEESARLMGIPKAIFVASALKRPQLLYMDPTTVAGHAHLMDEFEARHFVPSGVQELYLRRPIMLTFGDDNFELRLAFAEHSRLDEGDEQNFMILTEPRGKIQVAFLRALGHNPDHQHIHASAKPRANLHPANRRDHELLVSCAEKGLFKGYTFVSADEDKHSLD